jgi:predicted DNA-binding transcriptional regulator YafY
MPLDTLKVAKRLREAGFDEAQAEAVVAAVQESAERSDVATKSDLAAVRSELAAAKTELTARIDALTSTIDARIAEAKTEILYRVFQMILGAVLINIIAMAGLMFALVKLLGH